MIADSRLIRVLLLVAVACSSAAAAAEKRSRSMRYTSRSTDQAVVWQKELRARFFHILTLDDLVAMKGRIPFNPKVVSTVNKGKYTFHEIEISTTPGRRMKVSFTVPTSDTGPFPAVVCIAGHGGSRLSCYKPGPGYSGFAHTLAERGYVTISVRVSQHKVQEKGRTLMGERLWDLMRCVDYLASRKAVDARRIGCGGLSLGGEMAMWLGGMDPRVKATVSSGFLTTMDQLERNHCTCWKFRGLRELADFADIYALTAPRALLCQNGLKERPTWFSVPIARKALKEIEVIYADMKCPANVSLVAHPAGHAIDAPSLLAFFDKHLGAGKAGAGK